MGSNGKFAQTSSKSVETTLSEELKTWFAVQAKVRNMPLRDYVRDILLAHYELVTGDERRKKISGRY